MAVNLPPASGLLAVPGVELASLAAGIRYHNRKDLVLIRLAAGTQVAGVFTRNAFCAAPVLLARRHLARDQGIRALLINSGNANAGTGQAGLSAAEQCCAQVAQTLDLMPEAVLPMSTGVIGQALPLAPFAASMVPLRESLAADRWLDAAQAIMTTDTVAKGVSKQIQLEGKTVTITGIAKGAGMIRPDMATMLAFVATDAALDKAGVQALLDAAVAVSFNAITVDGDTSTNDACVLAATGQAGTGVIKSGSVAYEALGQALIEVCQHLAQACVRDAEGASRFIAIQVSGARSLAEARQVAYCVAHSPLVKTAAFAGDPNWGRILAAVGRSGIDDLDVSCIDLLLDDVALLRGGEPDPDYTEARGSAVAAQAEFTIRIALGRGAVSTTIWTCDFSYDYVKINAEYRT